MTEQWAPPAPPDEPVQEGARWRWHRPTGAQVAEWFATQPLDEGMVHSHYVGGVVLIPQVEKAKYTRPNGSVVERHEQVFTPYVQIGTRVGYVRRLAEYRELIYRAEPADVPVSTNPSSAYFNGNMEKGLWWHVVAGNDGPLRYLCATWTVALYEPTSYAAKLAGKDPMPVLSGRGTKQVAGGPDPNGIAKAQTGAIGRALGVAGILVIGTGIASAEDMQELPGYASEAPGPDQAQLPPTEIAPGQAPEPVDDASQLEALRARIAAMQAAMQEQSPIAWQTFVSWYRERAQEDGWRSINDVRLDGLKTIIARMERDMASLGGE